MKRNLLKYFIIAAVVILVGTGFAFAGGGNRYSHPPSAPYHGGYHHNNHYNHRWGYNHYQHNYYHGPRYPRYHHYGPPARYYYNPYYRGDCDRYDGAYYFSGAFSEPGFGFVFGTRGNW